MSGRKVKVDNMYYVPDGTQKCGYYMCDRCKEKFLSLQTMDTIACPYCEAELDMEMGPDDDMTQFKDNAKLISILEGEDVEKMDTLLSLAITGGNYDWI